MSVDVKMPLTAHLEELRWRLIRALLAVGLAFMVAYYFAEILFGFLTEPLLSLNASLSQGNPGAGAVQLIGTGVAEAFFTKLKVCFLAGVFAASPVILYQLWQFIAPGLYDNEKHYAQPFVFFGTIFFLAGAAFCYYLVLPVGYRFFVEEYGTIRVDPQIRISEYLTFTARMLLAFGVTFELPVITFFLARLGIVTAALMLHYLRYAVLLIVVMAAMLTPGPDIASQMLMAGPLLVLYLLSIGIAYLFAKPRAT
ncbi:MAG: twin-arginine translocase subunit TatC [Deltaproteobacteria bacterium]|nr:twin-arginine translocase subunit TatC [Deltaproteobacteria bacterium]